MSNPSFFNLGGKPMTLARIETNDVRRRPKMKTLATVIDHGIHAIGPPRRPGKKDIPKIVKKARHQEAEAQAEAAAAAPAVAAPAAAVAAAIPDLVDLTGLGDDDFGAGGVDNDDDNNNDIDSSAEDFEVDLGDAGDDLIHFS